ncbi:LysR substrate-binding domain-containing protein [Marinobacterium weihaiense]|uniref:LysR family transcriptional regulator n=1 Tax=Marinobacterium weihaiense TaxID=2851016 RepID=A0ABS6MA18_9GAMM|nr:LysR substrate-binding domain-containing protein [Marinobacterium weihaiense]MBV0933128.1 LysR family transcriptional regulator [Marinobacterium weihaiense]
MTRSQPQRPLDLVLLNTFVSVIEKGGFTAAAEHLHLAQPTVSAHIKRLEGVLGRPLLERGQKLAAPTVAGEKLLLHARQMLRQNRLAWQDIHDQRLAGVVRLGIPEDYLGYLPAALSDFDARFPAVELEVHCGLSVDLMQDVETGVLDLAITTRQPRSPGGEVLRREPMIWVGATGFDTQQRSPLPLAVSRQGVCIFRDHTLSSLDTAGISWRIAYTSVSLSGLSAAVRAGLAVTVLTPSMLGSGMRVLKAGLPELPHIEIALHRREYLTEAAQLLATQLQAHIEGHASAHWTGRPEAD